MVDDDKATGTEETPEEPVERQGQQEPEVQADPSEGFSSSGGGKF